MKKIIILFIILFSISAFAKIQFNYPENPSPQEIVKFETEVNESFLQFIKVLKGRFIVPTNMIISAPNSDNKAFFNRASFIQIDGKKKIAKMNIPISLNTGKSDFANGKFVFISPSVRSVFAHEFSHYIFFVNSIRRFKDDMEIIKKIEIANRERFKVVNRTQEESKRIQSEYELRISQDENYTAYDEFFADLSAAVVFDDPLIHRNGPYEEERNFLEKFKSIKKSYACDPHHYFVTLNKNVWDLYKKSKLSPSEFLERVLIAIHNEYSKTYNDTKFYCYGEKNNYNFLKEIVRQVKK